MPHDALRTSMPKVLSLIAALLLAPGAMHAQVRVEATSDNIRGRAPVVVFQPILNVTAAGQSPTPGQLLRVQADATDPDGDAVGAVTYRWLRSGVELATGDSYTPTAEDAGRTLVVEASAETDPLTTDPAIGTATLDVPVAANSAPSVSNVGISGTYEVGQTLTGTYTFDDADGDAEDAAGMAFAWYVSNRDTGVLAQVGTGRTYVLRGEDQGHNQTVVFSVERAKSLTGTPNEGLRPTTPAGQWQQQRVGAITGRAPVATNVEVTGTLQVGQVVTGRYDFTDADGDAEEGSSLVWYRANDASGTIGSIVGGQIGSGATYTVQAADQGHHLLFYVIPTTSNLISPSVGEGVFAASATRVPGTAPSVSNVGISGTYEVGQTLTGTYTFDDADGDAEDAAGMAFAWYVSNRDTGVLAQVGTGRTYVLRGEDQGHNQTVVFSVERAKSLTGTPNEGLRPTAPPGQWQQQRVGAITGRAPVATNVEVTGTLQVGQVVTGRYDFTDADGDAEEGSSLVWYRASDASGTIGSIVGGQIGSGATYTVQAADQGHHLLFYVIPTTSNLISPSAGEGVFAASATRVPGTAPSVRNVGISGTYEVGQTLTGTYTFDDADGDAEDAAGMAFAWYVSNRDTGVLAQVGTGRTYVLRGEDQGHNQTVVFSVERAKSLTGTPNEGLRPTAPPGQWQQQRVGAITGRAPVATNVEVTGTLQVGQVVTGRYDFTDADGDAEEGSSLVWYRANDASGTIGSIVGGQIGSGATYTVQAADQGHHLLFYVIPTTSNLISPSVGEGVFAASATRVPGTAPSVSNVGISGTYEVGQTLTGTYTFDDADGDAEDAAGMAFAWYVSNRDTGVLAQVGTGRTYVLRGEDQGHNQTVVFSVERAKSLTGTPNEGLRPTTPAGQWQQQRVGAITGRAPVATNVEVTGTLQVGQVATGRYDFTDADGDAEEGSSLVWYRANDASGTIGSIVGGQIGSGATYTVQAADQGHHLLFYVIPGTSNLISPSVGEGVFAASATRVAGNAPLATNVQITGTVQAGQTLTGSYTYADAEGDAEGASVFQWYRADDAAGTVNKTLIVDATATSYTIVAADLGKFLVFEVTPVSQTGTPNTGAPVSTVSAASVQGTAPSVTNINISGFYEVGQTLTGTYTFVDAEGDAEDVAGMAYAWHVGDVATGAPVQVGTGRTYVLQGADQGPARRIWFTVEKAKSLTGTPNEQLRPTDPPGQWQRQNVVAIGGRMPTMTAPSITGAVAVGQTLTGVPTGYHDADGDPPGTHGYYWSRADDAAGVANRTAIPGATSLTYTVVPADQGKYLVFMVVPRSASGMPSQGNQVGVVTAVRVPGTAPTATNVAISGTVQAGQTLTGSYTYTDAENDAEGASVFQWYRAGNPAGTGATAISGATARTYRPVGADRDMYLVFEVTPKSATGAPDTGLATRTVTATTVLGTLPTASITGWSYFGDTLLVPGESRTLGANVSQSDADGDPLGTPTYQWYRVTPDNVATAIPGATGTSFVIDYDVANYDVRFEIRVTPRSANGEVGPVRTARYPAYLGLRVVGTNGVLAPPGGSLPMTLPAGLGAKRVQEIQLMGESTWNFALRDESYTLMRGATAACRYDRTTGNMGGTIAGFTLCPATGTFGAASWSLRGEFTGGNATVIMWQVDFYPVPQF